MNPNLNFWLYPEVYIYIYIYTHIYRTRSQLFFKKKIKNESEIEFLAPSGNIHQKFH